MALAEWSQFSVGMSSLLCVTNSLIFFLSSCVLQPNVENTGSIIDDSVVFTS